MSRPSVAAQRTLTLTEELEKLEQSITLTLQGNYFLEREQQTQIIDHSIAEIDHNFSRAHRIVTTSILPIVEQYAEHSKDVWEGSKVCNPSPPPQHPRPDIASSGNNSSKLRPTYPYLAMKSLQQTRKQ